MTDKAEYVVDRAGIEALRETCHQIAALCEQRNKTAETGKIFMVPAMSMHTDAVLALLDTIDTLTAEVEALKEQQIENAIYISRLQEQTMRAPEQQEAEDGR